MLVWCLVDKKRTHAGAKPDGPSEKKQKMVPTKPKNGPMDGYLVSPFLFDPGFASRLDELERGVQLQSAPLGKICFTSGAEG